MSPRDEDLALITSSTAMQGVADKGSEKDTEGGFYAIIRMLLGTCTGTSVLVEVEVLCSIDGGTNDFNIGQFPVIDHDDDDLEIARVVYIPRPASGQSVTKVKLHTVSSGGSTPVVPCLRADIEPLVSLGVPAVDEGLSKGLAALI